MPSRSGSGSFFVLHVIDYKARKGKRKDKSCCSRCRLVSFLRAGEHQIGRARLELLRSPTFVLIDHMAGLINQAVMGIGIELPWKYRNLLENLEIELAFLAADLSI